ncbi:MAG: ATP-binding protein [Gaiellaceae bacterium]
MGTNQSLSLPDLELQLLSASALTLLSVEDPEELLRSLVDVLVPLVADYAGADVLEDDRMRQIAITPGTGAKYERAAEARAAATGFPPVHVHVIANRRGIVFPEIDDDTLRRTCRSEEHYELCRTFGIRSWMCVPLVGEDGVIALVTLATVGAEGRVLDEPELAAVSHAMRTIAVGVERASLRRENDGQRRLLETVIEELPIGLSVVEAGTDRVLMTNRLSRELLGPASVTYSTDVDRRTENGEPLPRELWPVTRGLGGETIRDERLRIRRADGSEILTLINVAPVTDESGVIAAVITVHDITERDRREQDFLANAAHQLRTPVAAIASALGALQLGAKNETIEREFFLSHVQREVDRAARLTDSLLSLARLERGFETPDRVAVSLCPLLEMLLQNLQLEAPKTIRLDCPQETIVIVNGGLLREALSNVIENAVRYSGNGEVRVVVSNVNGSTLIDVQDSGPGITPVDADQIFDRFFRGRKSPGGGDGAGLGLAIAREATLAAGGDLTLQSAGPPTTFRFTLPRSIGDT